MQKRKIMSESRIQQPGPKSKAPSKTVQVNSISGTGKVNVGVNPSAPSAAAQQPVSKKTPVQKAPVQQPRSMTPAVQQPAPQKAQGAKFNAGVFVQAAGAKVVPMIKSGFEKRSKARAEKAAQAKQAKPVASKEPFRPGLRLLTLAGATLSVMIVLMLVLQFAGRETETQTAATSPAVAPTTKVQPLNTTPEPFAAQADTTSSVQSSSDVLVGNIIDALRQSANSAPSAETASAPASEGSGQAAAANNLAQIVVGALAQGKSETEIQTLLNEAQAKGEIQVPAPLLREDGSVDASTILTLFAGN